MQLLKEAKFFREHMPRYMDCEGFEAWLDWADASGFLLRVFPDEGKHELVAAAIIRPINQEQLDAEYDSFVCDEDGDILFIDACVAINKPAMQALGFAVLQRFNEREAVAFNSHDRGIKVHDFDKARKALFKIRN